MSRSTNTAVIHHQNVSCRVGNDNITGIFTKDVVPIQISGDEVLAHRLLVVILGQRPRDLLIDAQNVREREDASAADSSAISISLRPYRGRGLANTNETATASNEAS